MAAPAFFLGTICLENYFPAFYSEVVSVFVTEVHFLYAENTGSCLFIQSVSLYLFIGKLSPLMLRDIRHQRLLITATFVLKRWNSVSVAVFFLAS